MSRRTLSTIATVVAVLVVLGVTLWGRGSDDPSGGRAREPGAASSRTVDPTSGLRWVDAADLPEEARQTLDLVDVGGPFPYPGKDGSTFLNLERLLPQESRGYYAEYT